MSSKIILQFKQQSYQNDATQAVVDCFDGQAKGDRKEIVARTGLFEESIFSNKKLELNDELLKNVQETQKGQGLKASQTLAGLHGKPHFSIEMETGTGKTYVYTKTMYELNQKYGWSKFIIMVPSVAIREGVHKSLEITADHFQEIYGKKIRFSIYNTQNKSNLVNIKSFANTSNIEVLIMNYQAFATKSQESRKIYQKLDAMQSERPIDIIKRARPILIIDEPQRFGQSEELFKEFDPLFVLRYSATHKKDKEYNKVYRLDAIDAFNQKLVKKISVKGIEVLGNAGTNSYLFLDKINISSKQYPTANIEYEKKQVSGIKKVISKISEKDDLFQMSGDFAQYKGFVVKEINGLTNQVSFTNGIVIGVGQSIGEVDENHIRRIQIRETIKSHLEKERLMFDKGIKVLSLFFIDEVAKYRDYEQANDKGEYARVFEEEYQIAITEQDLLEEDYNKYLNRDSVDQIHNGYFSVDKKGKMVDAISNAKSEKLNSTDISAYDLIMKNKERLLSFDEPTRFIFSHSALREGWDNPNVFQICTLKHSQADDNKRQEIGRGLRICVKSSGEGKGTRMDESVLGNDFFDINTLTVIASESYDSFSKQLQKEIVESLSDRPTILTTEILVNRVLKDENGNTFIFDNKTAMDLIIKFKEQAYLDSDYKITDKLIADIDSDTVELPATLLPFKSSVCELMRKIHSTANFKASTNDMADNIDIPNFKPNDNFAKKEFQHLWNKIKVKTVYEVDFDGNELVKKSVATLDNTLTVKKVIVKITGGEQAKVIDEASLKAGTSMVKKKDIVYKADSLLGAVKYDLIGEITKETKLTRKTVATILSQVNAETFNKFRVNPESFIKEVSKTINAEKATTLINNIIYSKTDQTYEDNLFTLKSFKGSLSENVLKVQKHVYDYVKTDSKTERQFATDLETGEVLVYAKLPNDFKIPTPIGDYNPDWAIVFDTDQFKYVYFIAETKGSMDSLQLKEAEKRKINYAKKHFESLGHLDIKYDVITTYQDLRDMVM
jgi:type III restriction enzyme